MATKPTEKFDRQQLQMIVDEVLAQVISSNEFKATIASAIRRAIIDISMKTDREKKAAKLSSASGMATVKQAAEFLQVSIDTVYRMVADGTIQSTRVRDSIRIPWDAISKD